MYLLNDCCLDFNQSRYINRRLNRNSTVLCQLDPLTRWESPTSTVSIPQPLKKGRGLGSPTLSCTNNKVHCTQKKRKKFGCYDFSANNTKCILKNLIRLYLNIKSFIYLSAKNNTVKQTKEIKSLKMFIFVRIADNFLLNLLVYYYNKHPSLEKSIQNISILEVKNFKKKKTPDFFKEKNFFNSIKLDK